MELEDEINLMDTSGFCMPAKVVAQMYEFYISGEIREPEYYIKAFNIIRYARENDTVKLYLNSFGGDMFSAIQFMRVLAETEAEVIVSIEGAAMSAATLLFLVADSVEITPNSSIMIHNYSSGTMGKGNEMHSQITHEAKWANKLFHEVYEDFLTEQEIISVLDGRDIWLSSDDVMERLQKRAETRKELTELEESTRP